MSDQTGSHSEENHTTKSADKSGPTPQHSPTKSDPIVLQVGERRFFTFPSILTMESPYFTCLLSAQWQRVQADGSYFIDADGDLFTHILRYLRSGQLPIFYNSLTGHDYSTYHALLGEAEYFRIERLKDWLKNKEYEKAIKIEHSIGDFEGVEGMAKTCHSNVQLEYHPTWVQKRVYVCPRGIYVHRGNPSRCGRLCHIAQGDAEDEYEDEEVLRATVISRRTVLDHSLCFRE